MSDNPLEPSPEREQRIRERAYFLWLEDGCPEGRDRDHWERAEDLVAMEEHPGAGLLPNPQGHEAIPGVTVEEASIQKNLGEFPDRFADQGEWRQTPMTRDERAREARGRTQPGWGRAP
ncbi:conserved protein of unknown function [Rhodovastum atsumiense]|uniref:DUF2934 domain-containing protein n=1 Tax=Rhodovastum atsumiense TaxID=504468 RepID=A0A5M6IX22_9PROT|nr:DUF2934 domain-containing protein [Rhodovastum atsumiense]KAA5612863.1 DUF2934 domain-containing protein [Rhodovastum atsumiense]CAH2601067.1 conserved protein of unknown function [Rhodovastum atsumiense]